jgi:hypothetical protein
VELSGDEGEEGLVCPAEMGLLLIAGGTQGLSCTHSLTSPGDIGTGSCSSKGMGNCLDIDNGSLGIRCRDSVLTTYVEAVRDSTMDLSWR